jgi:hypothetical protein
MPPEMPYDGGFRLDSRQLHILYLFLLEMYANIFIVCPPIGRSITLILRAYADFMRLL